MPSKNSVNRPKNKNTARAKAQHKSAVARRKPQTAIIRGKVDSKKVQQKKLRRTRLASALDKDADEQEDGSDVDMADEEEAKVLNKLDTKSRKEAKRAAMLEEQEEFKNESAEKIFKMDTTSGKGTTLGGPPKK